MDIEIVFSLDKERKRIKDHYNVFDWLKENKYAEPIMPAGISFYSSSEEESLSKLDKEYDETDYKEFAKELNQNFSKVKEVFSSFLEDVFPGEVPKKVFIVLSKYGLGGSYFPPDIVEVNFNRHSSSKTVSLLCHEIIHLILEKYVEEHELSHWEKERTVDLLLHHDNKLGLDYWQPRYHGTEEYVDKLFQKFFFSDRKKYFQEVVKSRPDVK